MSGVTVGFWCTFTVGILTGTILTGFLWVPYQHRRWLRTSLEERADIARITAGLPAASIGRHAAPDDITVELRLDDAVGAFAQASIAPIPSPYPGDRRTPEPAWVRWVEEHGRSATRPPKAPRWWRWRDQLNQVAFVVGFVALVALWRLDLIVRAAHALLLDAQAAVWPTSLDLPRGFPSGLKQ